MLTQPFNGHVVATYNNHIAIEPTTTEAVHELIKQLIDTNTRLVQPTN